MKVLIFGENSGFIGSHLSSSLKGSMAYMALKHIGKTLDYEL